MKIKINNNYIKIVMGYFRMRKSIKKVLAVALCGLLSVAAFSGCDKDSASVASSKPVSVFKKEVLNFTEPEEGEEIAVLTIKDYGTVKIQLFPEIMPKEVENFKELIKTGYYDGLIFHRVMEKFMIQGGDPKGNGTGGESFQGEKIAGTFTDELCHFTGALAYARSSQDYNFGSQFYIVSESEKLTEDSIKQLAAYYKKTYSKDIIDKYIEHGGAPHLDGDYCVFGQVIEGLSVVNKVAKVSVDGYSKPKEDVIIESIKLEEYKK